jgi:hypothetical protein
MAEEIITQHKKQERRISWKAIGIISGSAALFVAVITGIILFTNWRNNGEAYAQRLSEQIGVSAETAQKYTHVNLKGASTFACVNMAAEEYPYLYESTRRTEVLGVTIPEWVIYVGEKNHTVTDVLFYNYKQLQKYGSGVKLDDKLDIAGITSGMNQDAVHQYVGFDPLCTAFSTKGFTESYKYWFKDQNTGSTVSYMIRVDYDDGICKDVKEEENLFILPYLSER